MISFAEGEGNWSSDKLKLTQAQIKKLISAIVNESDYKENSQYDGLNSKHIKEIIDYLMFVENNNSIYIIIDKEKDGYHLSLTIDQKK